MTARETVNRRKPREKCMLARNFFDYMGSATNRSNCFGEITAVIEDGGFSYSFDFPPIFIL